MIEKILSRIIALMGFASFMYGVGLMVAGLPSPELFLMVGFSLMMGAGLLLPMETRDETTHTNN